MLLITSNSKLIFKAGNGILQIGNGIIYPISWPLINTSLAALGAIAHRLQHLTAR